MVSRKKMVRKAVQEKKQAGRKASVGKTPGKRVISRQTPLREILADDYECRQCGGCCSFASGYLIAGEAKRIAEHLGIEEAALKTAYLDEVVVFNKKMHKPKQLRKGMLPHGSCIFLEKNRCSIHPVKPLHCRVANYGERGEAINEWFHLNYIVDESDPQALREWHARVEIRGGTIPGGYLKDLERSATRRRKIQDYDDLRVDEKKLANKLLGAVSSARKKTNGKISRRR